MPGRFYISIKGLNSSVNTKLKNETGYLNTEYCGSWTQTYKDVSGVWAEDDILYDGDMPCSVDYSGLVLSSDPGYGNEGDYEDTEGLAGYIRSGPRGGVSPRDATDGEDETYEFETSYNVDWAWADLWDKKFKDDSLGHALAFGYAFKTESGNKMRVELEYASRGKTSMRSDPVFDELSLDELQYGDLYDLLYEFGGQNLIDDFEESGRLPVFVNCYDLVYDDAQQIWICNDAAISGNYLSASYTSSMSNESWMLNLYWDLDENFYIGAGIGLANITTTFSLSDPNGDFEQRFKDLGLLEKYGMYFENEDEDDPYTFMGKYRTSTLEFKNLAYSASVGFTYPINAHLTLDVGYRYIDMGEIAFGYKEWHWISGKLQTSEITAGIRISL